MRSSNTAADTPTSIPIPFRAFPVWSGAFRHLPYRESASYGSYEHRTSRCASGEHTESRGTYSVDVETWGGGGPGRGTPTFVFRRCRLTARALLPSSPSVCSALALSIHLCYLQTTFLSTLRFSGDVLTFYTLFPYLLSLPLASLHLRHLLCIYEVFPSTYAVPERRI